MGHKNESTTWKYLQYLKRKEALKEKISVLDSIMHQALEEANEQDIEINSTLDLGLNIFVFPYETGQTHTHSWTLIDSGIAGFLKHIE